jgi:hypothetical protein
MQGTKGNQGMRTDEGSKMDMLLSQDDVLVLKEPNNTLPFMRHFSHIENGQIHVFSDGRSSFTAIRNDDETKICTTPLTTYSNDIEIIDVIKLDIKPILVNIKE